MIPIPAHEVRRLSTQRLGKQVWSFPCLDSTNTLALSLANDPTKDGLVILAHEQSAGRGQYGRSWTAPPGSSVLMSVLLFPPPYIRRPAVLTAWAGVSVCATIQEVTGLEATIKWPNDVLIQGRKVCGILIEQRSSGPGDPPATVAGIGLNVGQSAEYFTRANLPLGASLTSLSGKTLETRLVAERLIRHLDVAYDQLVRGDIDTLEMLWKERVGLVGRHVVVETFDQIKEGRLLGLAWDGVLLEESSAIVHIAPEMVRHMRDVNTD
jgi:BirA family biotin operon repressor/biotin-[acetyl-CoA-carboxylase] ligase